MSNIRFRFTPEELVSAEHMFVEDRLADFRRYKTRQWSSRYYELFTLFSILSFHQFGVRPSIAPLAIVDLGRELGREFFELDWWRSSESDIERMSRDDENPMLQWLRPFRLSMTFAVLGQDNELLALLGDWPAEWMQAEWNPVPLPIGIEQFYFALLAKCGFAELNTDITEVKDKRLPILIESLQGDSDLGEALNKSLKLFKRSLRRTGLDPDQAIGVEETLIVYLWRMLHQIDLLPEIDEPLRIHILQLVEMK